MCPNECIYSVHTVAVYISQYLYMSMYILGIHMHKRPLTQAVKRQANPIFFFNVARCNTEELGVAWEWGYLGVDSILEMIRDAVNLALATYYDRSS